MGFVSGNHILLLIIFLVVVLIIFGPGKLPDIGSGMGRAIREFRKASSEVKESVHSSVKEEPKAAEPARPAPLEDFNRESTAQSQSGDSGKVKIGG